MPGSGLQGLWVLREEVVQVGGDRGAGLEGGLCAGLAPRAHPRSRHMPSPSSRCRKGHLDRVGDGAPGNAPRGGDCPVALGWHAHWRGRGCGQAPPGLLPGPGEALLSIPHGAPRHGLGASRCLPGSCLSRGCPDAQCQPLCPKLAGATSRRAASLPQVGEQHSPPSLSSAHRP